MWAAVSLSRIAHLRERGKSGLQSVNIRYENIFNGVACGTMLGLSFRFSEMR
jgi:hypothetical protein